MKAVVFGHQLWRSRHHRLRGQHVAQALANQQGLGGFKLSIALRADVCAALATRISGHDGGYVSGHRVELAVFDCAGGQRIGFEQQHGLDIIERHDLGFKTA